MQLTGGFIGTYPPTIFHCRLQFAYYFWVLFLVESMTEIASCTMQGIRVLQYSLMKGFGHHIISAREYEEHKTYGPWSYISTCPNQQPRTISMHDRIDCWPWARHFVNSIQMAVRPRQAMSNIANEAIFPSL